MSGVGTTPIAVYQVKQPESTFRFELRADAVRVLISDPRADVDTTIPLRELKPAVSLRATHTSGFFVGFGIHLVGAFFVMLITVAAMLVELTRFPAAPMAIAGGCATIGLVAALARRHPVGIAEFRSWAGVPILVIPMTAGDSSEFDEFLTRLVKQIRTWSG
jgi:hypothetical protein